jgi:hypothetical protein
MSNPCKSWVALVVPFVTCSAVAAAGAGPLSIHLKADAKSDQSVFEVVGLSPALLASLRTAGNFPESCAKVLTVYVETTPSTDHHKQPPLLGTYELRKDILVFKPRFPLRPGLRYRALLVPLALSDRAGASRDDVSRVFEIPAHNAATPASVHSVYPSASCLPENQLKFYIHFSAPMSRSEAYSHIRLLDASGKPILFAFLELDEELWDRDNKRFTLFLDPGRIKRGLKPREEFGPALEEGKSYTLVIDQAWPDADGHPMKEAYRKEFRVGPPDDQPPDPKAWKIELPVAGTLKPVVVTFPKPMDHALLGRMLRLNDRKGRKLEGSITIGNEERQWSFQPEGPWVAGHYQLVVDTALEDLAGNSIGRPFEIDVFHPVQSHVREKTLAIPIEISK